MRYQLDKEGIRRYKEELDKQLAERKKEFPENEYTKGSDLATLISDGKSAQGMRRWESLPKLSSTDITRSYVMWVWQALIYSIMLSIFPRFVALAFQI